MLPLPRLAPRLAQWVIAASVVTAIGCAAGARQGGASPARTTVAPEGPTPTTIDDAVADIDRWRQVLGVPDERARGGYAQATPTTPPPPPPAAAPQTTNVVPVAPTDADAAEESKSATTEADTTTASPPPACVTPCKAIASMRRSVDALCRLAGETDARCVDARGTLQRSEQKVARCGC
jgi:hypothetical protein